ncbi:MAG: MFS transporter [Calditrichia bacterium]
MKSLFKNPMFRFLAVLTIASTAGLQGWRTLFNNFAVEAAHLNGDHIGWIQAVREIPGFLALLAIFVMMFVKEHKLSAISILVLGLGVLLTGFFPSFLGLALTTLLMSFGFHYYETTNQSLTLQYFDQKTSPYVFGKLRSLAAASNIAIGALIFGMTFFLSYTNMYVLVGVMSIAAGLWGILQDPTDKDLIPQRKRLIFKRKYGLFYFLTFMAGARRQIFVAFSVFLMVKNFHFSVQEITVLFIINNLVNYFLSPIIGKAILLFGERRVLSLEYFAMIFIFIGYAVTQSKVVLMGLYILDHIFFNFSIAIRTFFQKIGEPQDIAPSMAVGFTINHIAAVVIPAFGGLLWMVDYRIPFIGAALLSIISLIATQWIRPAPTVVN